MLNTHEAEKILRENVKVLPEPLKSAVEFTLTNFYASNATDEAKKFLAGLPSMTTTDAKIDVKKIPPSCRRENFYS